MRKYKMEDPDFFEVVDGTIYLLSTTMLSWSCGNQSLVEQYSGHMFYFDLLPSEESVWARVFEARLRVNSNELDPTQYNIGWEIVAALRAALNQRIEEEELGNEDQMHFSLQHPVITHTGETACAVDGRPTEF